MAAYKARPQILLTGHGTSSTTGYKLNPHLILTLVNVDIIFVRFRSAYLDSNHFVVVAITIIHDPNNLVQSMTHKNLLKIKAFINVCRYTERE